MINHLVNFSPKNMGISTFKWSVNDKENQFLCTCECVVGRLLHRQFSALQQGVLKSKALSVEFQKLLLHIHSSSFLWHTQDLQKNIWLNFIQKSFTFYKQALFPLSMLKFKRQLLYLSFLSLFLSFSAPYFFLRLDELEFEFAKPMFCEMHCFDGMFALNFALNFLTF